MDENIRTRIRNLHDASSVAGSSGEMQRSIELAKEAIDLAETNGLVQEAHHNRWHLAVALYSVGQLKASMAAVAPLLQLSPQTLQSKASAPNLDYETGPFEMLLVAYVVYVRAGMDVPVSAKSIEKVLQEAERLVTDKTHSYFRSHLLRARATLLSLQGRYQKALNVLQEAAAINSDDEPFLIDMALVALDLEQID